MSWILLNDKNRTALFARIYHICSLTPSRVLTHCSCFYFPFCIKIFSSLVIVYYCCLHQTREKRYFISICCPFIPPKKDIYKSSPSPLCAPATLSLYFFVLQLSQGNWEREREREVMDAVLQTRGLLSLPANPVNRISLFNPSQGLKHRFFSPKPKNLSGSSLSSNGFPKLSPRPNNVFAQRDQNKNLFLCRAEAAAAAASFGEPGSEKPKLLGIEVATLKKIVPLGLMFFCILFNYTILRDTKDVLVVTARGSSAEIIPFLKTWVNLPMAIGFMLLYTKLANVLSKQALFYSIILPFIAFFGAFGFVLYPLSNYIHPEAFADKLLNILGPRFLGPLAIMRIWSFCLFYVMAELWGSVVISVLFWGFANQVVSLFELWAYFVSW